MKESAKASLLQGRDEHSRKRDRRNKGHRTKRITDGLREANTTIFLGTSGRVAGGNYKNCRRSRRVRYRGFFFFKEQLFGVVLVPKDDGFITYQLLNRMAAWAGGAMESFSVRLINTGLARQFIIHMKTALCAGVLCASPYILYQLFVLSLPHYTITNGDIITQTVRSQLCDVLEFGGLATF